MVFSHTLIASLVICGLPYNDDKDKVPSNREVREFLLAEDSLFDGTEQRLIALGERASSGPINTCPPVAITTPAVTEAEIKEVRELLNGIEFKEQKTALIKMGNRAYPAFQVILADSNSKSQHLRRAMGVIASVAGERRQFVDPAVRYLSDPAWEIRASALRLLEQIGSSRDVAPVVALLSDERMEVSYAAAKTLIAIGDQRTVAAFDVWLSVGNHRDNDLLLAHVKKCRDELKERLKKAKPPAK